MMDTQRVTGAHPRAGSVDAGGPATAATAADAAVAADPAIIAPASPGDDAAGPHATGPFSPRYLSFITATGLSSLGDAAWVIALTATLTRLSDAAVGGAVLALAGVPRVVAMLGGGAMADRRGARWVMVRTDVLRFVVMGVAAAAVAIWSPNIPLLLVLAALLAFLGSFFIPASGALRPRLLPDRYLVKGNALYLIGLRSGQAAGGPVGAWLLGLGGVGAVAITNAVSYLVSAFATLKCAPKDPPPVLRAPAGEGTGKAEEPGALRRIGEGLRYVLADRHLRALLMVIGLVELAGSGPLNIGLILISDNLGSGAAGAGLLLTAYTVGATAIFLLSLVLPVERRAGTFATGSMLAYSAVLVALGHAGSIGVAVVLYGLLGGVSAQESLMLTSMVQRRLPSAARARVMSIMSLLIFGAVPLGNLSIGVLIQWFGVPTTMAVQGALGLVATLLFVANRTLRGASLA